MSKSRPLYMESTEIPVERTALEIQALLVTAGARETHNIYDDAGKVVGMTFVLVINGMRLPFKLPVRTASVQEIFKRRRQQTMKWRAHEFAQKDAEQAERVAWRQLLRWVQAQLAMVDAGMVASREVFLPYLQEPGGTTVFEYFEETRYKALPAPEQS